MHMILPLMPFTPTGGPVAAMPFYAPEDRYEVVGNTLRLTTARRTEAMRIVVRQVAPRTYKVRVSFVRSTLKAALPTFKKTLPADWRSLDVSVADGRGFSSVLLASRA